MNCDVLVKARPVKEGGLRPVADLSVVICSLNGASGLHRCLHALAAQTIRSRLEIVVVDDGSADGTGDVADRHDAIVVRHAVNRGLAAARNSGLRAAAAPVVAFLDDDCEPEPEWAEGLLAGYGESVLGVCGPILPSAPEGFMSGYLKRHNPLRPLELDLARSQRALYRLYLYLQRQWVGGEEGGRRDVYSFAGANMSFRRRALLDVGGFDERFRFGAEDGDLCRRLSKFPRSRLVFAPDAKVVHHFESSMRDTLRRSRAYGCGSARLYKKWPTLRPPVFPGPLIFLTLLILSVRFPILGAAAVVVPFLLYPQAVRSVLAERRAHCLLDAYLQLAQEFSENIGVLQGLWRFRRLVPGPATELATAVPGAAAGPETLTTGSERTAPSPMQRAHGRHARPFSTRRLLGIHVAALALIAALVGVRGLWAAQLLLIPLLLIVPGFILLRAVRIPGSAVASFPVYVPCASLVVLLGSGLAVDLAGPLVGVAAPLRPGPLLAGLEAVCLTLLAFSARGSPDIAIPWRSLSQPGRCMLPLILPLAAAAGALRLNSGHANGVALAALSACVFMIIAGLLCAPRISTPVLAAVLYAVGLAVMWSFSLRGDLVYGFDISAEYYALHHTVLTGMWHTAHPGDAYGAMLSVTVMPAELHALSGVPDLFVFKVVYPAIAALFPVAVFGLARRVLSRRWAFAAAALILTQASFGQELPAIARQEIALVLFAAVVAAMLDARMPRRPQWALVALFALALALSHYSSTYLAIFIIGVALLLQWATSFVRRVPRVSGAFAVAFIAVVAGALTWYGPVTHSNSNLTQFIQTTKARGPDLLPNAGQAGGLLAVYLNGNTETPMQARQYAHLVHVSYTKYRPYIRPLPAAGLPAYALSDSSPPTPPVRWSLGHSALALGQVLAQQLIYLLAAVGALALALRRRTSAIARRVGLLAIATLLLLAVTRLSGTIATAYNAERAFLQAMVPLAIAVGWTMEALAGRRKGWHAGVLAAAAGLLAVIFVSSSGLAGAALGGGTAGNLSNSGEDFERFYVTSPELASARWLGAAVHPGQLAYADRYGQLPLIAVTGIGAGLILDVTPQTLAQHAWVYASRSNVIDKRARASYEDHSVSYVFPARFLNANYNLVYTDGSSEVYHR